MFGDRFHKKTVIISIVILLIALVSYRMLISVNTGGSGIAMSEPSSMSHRRDADRRQQIIAAAWQVISREGISAASLRTIAAEMAATTGLVTRYFPEKQGLLLAALEHAVGFLNREVAAANINLTGKARLDATVLAALPVTKERRLAWKVWVAFMAELPASPELARAHAKFPGSLRQTLVRGLREAQLAGDISPETYPPQMADTLVGQIIGLGVQTTIEPARYPAEKLPGLIAPFYLRMTERPD